MRALHIEPLADWIQGLFQQAADEAGVEVTWGGGMGERELRAAAAGADALVTAKRRIGADLIGASPGLRLIQVQGRAPWAVDQDAAAAAGVPVSVLPHRGAIAVAEQTVALMLGLYRKLVPGHMGTRDAEYRELGVEPVRTTERKIAFNWLRYPDVWQLHGRTLGLVGLGDIALEVARRARAFDMEVVYHKRSPLPREHEEMVGARSLPLPELLAQSDVVSLHAPHTDQTERMIDAAALALMKPTAILVNTARGGLVDEDALVDALRAAASPGRGWMPSCTSRCPGQPAGRCAQRASVASCGRRDRWRAAGHDRRRGRESRRGEGRRGGAGTGETPNMSPEPPC